MRSDWESIQAETSGNEGMGSKGQWKMLPDLEGGGPPPPRILEKRDFAPLAASQERRPPFAIISHWFNSHHFPDESYYAV